MYLEESTAVGNDLPVRRMIRGFHGSNAVHYTRVNPRDMGHQLGLGIRRTSEQDRTGLAECLDNPLKIFGFRGRVAAVTCVRLVMDVQVRMMTAYACEFGIILIEMKDFRFTMVDPCDCMEMLAAHICLALPGLDSGGSSLLPLPEHVAPGRGFPAIRRHT
ncbi:MAG: hypothetical protein ABI645_03605 [Pseudomonadota bacterium]